ncbi:MAG: DUF1385 domain-containing protein [Ruminococcus sp.]|uniref:DUF1385 domain-containing protein n=1 Tax=uncultured Ruminococcus sp. TaxID=165186 RepID=UPI00263812C2|nr:DUF1385 domain-containing protein [uncultured Ruminococcus sp.]MCR4861442.1 DUF1385 domain-containing protein [Ruminococcus sp.]
MSNNKSQSNEKFRSKIGGQALIEGIMMLGPNTGAMACRLPDGTIDLETWAERNGKNAPWYKKVPLVRGCTSFITSLTKGYKYMMKSAEKQLTEEEKDEEENTPAIFNAMMYIGMIVGIVMAVGLFIFLPKWLVGFVPAIKKKRILRSIVEGLVKIAIFVAYMAIVSLMKDIRRQYMYHGAEHKTIACHEAELPLTVENVRRQSRFHKRCGTSFIFIVLIVGIFTMCFVPFTVTWQRIAASLVMLPLVVGISYECIRLAGNHDNLFTRILSAPGLAMQRITTREPDDSMIEIAIAALTPCIPQDKEEDKW